MGLWRGALRDAVWTARDRGERRIRGAGICAGQRTGLDTVTSWHVPRARQLHPTVPAQGLEAAYSRHRRCPPRVGGRVRERRITSSGIRRGAPTCRMAARITFGTRFVGHGYNRRPRSLEPLALRRAALSQSV